MKANLNKSKKQVYPQNKINQKEDITDIKFYALKLTEKRFDSHLHINTIRAKINAYMSQ